MIVLTTVAIAAAVVMGLAAWFLVRRSVALPIWVIGIAGVLAMLVSGVAAAFTGVLEPEIAVAIAAGTIPVAVPLTAATRVGTWAPRTMLFSAAAWSAIVVPIAIVGPPLFVAGCPPEACVIEDFGGALPFAVSAGAFLLVPSLVTLGRNALRSGTGDRVRDAFAGLMLWAGYIVWLTALEGAVDEFTPWIALAAVTAPIAGALGWLIVDRVRGVDATVGRALRVGLLAGMAAILPGVVAVSLPWAIVIGFLGGAVGALTHDARGLMSSAPGTRAATAALVVGALAMLAPAIVGGRIGFVFAARADVVVTQLGAALAVAIVAIIVSIPVAMMIRRRG